jgi:hypothetical protein
MNDHSALLRAVALRLAERGHDLGDLQLVAQLSHAERRNLVLRCSGSGPGSIVVKQVQGAYDPENVQEWDTRRFFSDWVGAELLSSLDGEAHAARFFAGDRERGFIVLEDLGEPQRTPLELLQGGGATEAAAALRLYVTRLARMHGSTLASEALYDALLGALQGKAKAERLRYFGQDSAEKLCSFLREVEPLSDQLAEAIHDAVNGLDAPSPFHAFIHGDPCLDNAFLRDSSLLLIDFEMGRPGHALLDAVYVLSPFPTCGCTGLLPDELAFDLLETYRQELCRYLPAAADAAVFARAALAACSAWLIYRLGWSLREAWQADRAWGSSTTRCRILTALEQYLLAGRRYDGTPRLLGHAERLLHALRRRWPESASMPLYPAFRAVS